MRYLAAHGDWAWSAPRRSLAVGVALSLVALGSLSIVSPTLAAGAGVGLYAYAGGEVASPTSSSGCPATTVTTEQCNLAGALSLAGGGDTVYLATPGASQNYVGNWLVSPTGTSASAPLTIEPAPGVASPTLDGNDGSAIGCQTSSCSGQVLGIAGPVFLDLEGTTVENGNGSGILNVTDGTLIVSACTFSDNNGEYGGAIDNGTLGLGTLTVTSSTFSGNSATFGGAIENGDGGRGTLTVTSSTFSGNSATFGGAIGNGFSDTSRGPIIHSGTLTVTSSTFSGNTAENHGGAIDNGDDHGRGTLTVTSSTFAGNTAEGDGGAVDNGDDNGTGTLTVMSSTFSGNTAASGGTIDNSGTTATVWAAADIFSGACAQGGPWNDESYNVGSDSTCESKSGPVPGDDLDVANLGALLGPLADNGGPTETIALLAGNPAIRLVPNNTSVLLNSTSTQLCPTTDQRGVASPAGAPCNAGAVQYVMPVARTVSAQTDEATALAEPAGTLLSGVTDVNPGATSWTAALSAGPADGAVTVNADGSFTYTPAAGFVGADSFSYTVTDNLGYTSAPATASVAVVPVFSATVDGATSAAIAYSTAAIFAESGVPASATGTLSFSTTPGGLVLCSLSFPTAATSCTGPDDLNLGDYTVTASFDDTASGVSTPATGSLSLDVTAGKFIPVPTTTTPAATAPPAPVFPGAGLTYPNGAVVRFGGKSYVLAGGHAFLASPGQLAALGRVDRAHGQAAPPGALPPTQVPRPGTLLSTKAVDGAGTIYVAGTDGELHGFSTPHQFFANGYDAALVVTVPSLAGLRVGTTDGVTGPSATALATRADGALVDSAGTFYVLAGGRAFGIASPAVLGRVRAADPAQALTGTVGPAETGASMAAGVLVSAPGMVYVSYQGSLYLFDTLAQLAADGYAGSAAVPVPSAGGLRAVVQYSK